MLLILIEYAILASTFTIAKMVLAYCRPFFLIATRMCIAGFFLTAYAALSGQVVWQKVKNDWHLFLQAGLFHCYLAFIPEFWALQYMTSAKASILYATTPFVAAFLAWILHRKQLTLLKFTSMLVGVAGLIPLILMRSGVDELSQLGTIALPELVLLGAVVSACYAWFVITQLMRRGHHFVLINGIAMSIGGILSIPTFLIHEGAAWQAVTNWSAFAGWLTLLILLAHVISYNLYSWLLTRYSITFMTFCGFLCPLISTALGALFLGEPISWHYWLSLASITTGLSIYYCAEK